MVKRIVKHNDGDWECEITQNELGLDECVKLNKIIPIDKKSHCIMCGNIVALGTNVRCETCNLEWLREEHKDNQNWAVRHIRLLEKEVAELKARLDELESKPNENV